MPSCLTGFAAAFWSFQAKVMPLSGKVTSIEISMVKRIYNVNTLCITRQMAQSIVI